MSSDGLRGDGKVFKYSPLDINTKEFRLLIVWPALWKSSPIRCSTLHCQVNKYKGAYFALSYTWETSTEKKMIFLDGAEFLVQPNLESALRHVRSRFLPLYIWADAVCINQDDNDERARQVMLMRDIYSNCIRVRAWLGPSADDDRGMDLIKAITKQFRASDRECSPKFIEWILSTVSVGFTDCAWSSLADLLQRAWWTRVWVVQEVILARGVTVNYGSHFIDIQEFVFFYTALHSFIVIVISKADVPVDDERRSHFERVARGLEQGLNPGVYETIVSWAARRERVELASPEYEGPSQLFSLVRKYHSFGASDPLDKVYALLGLIANQESEDIVEFRPNYNISITDLYTRFARYSLHEKTLLKVLESCGENNPALGLPSWVPDWSSRPMVQSISQFSFEPDNVFKAGGDRVATWEVSDTLIIHGILVDVVDILTEIFPDEPSTFSSIERESLLIVIGEDQQDACAQNFTMLDVMETYKDDLDEPYIFGGTKFLAFARTIFAMPTLQRDRFPSFWDEDNVVPSAYEYNTCPQDTPHWASRTATVRLGRRFGLSLQGYICLIPAATKSGDWICVFPGLKVPFILHQHGKDYKLIGNCFVQGLMEGEALAKVEEDGLKISEIRLV